MYTVSLCKCMLTLVTNGAVSFVLALSYVLLVVAAFVVGIEVLSI